MTTSIEEKIHAISSRIGFPLTRTLLGGSLKITGLGLAPLTQKITELLSKDSTIIQLIDQFYKSTLVGGNLYCKCYKFDNDVIEEIIRHLNLLEKTDTEFDENYPYPLPHEKLLETSNKLHFMERLEPSEDDSFNKYIFTSRNSFSVRKLIDKSNLIDHEDGEYDSEEVGQLYLQVREQVQTFNSILVSQKFGMVLVCADCSKIPQTETKPIFLGLETILKKCTSTRMLNPINLFSCIENLYTSEDGYISSIHFVTGVGNAASMNLKNGLKCIKNDVYHQSGELAVGNLLKYEISKYWNFMPFTDKFISISLSLNGKKTMIENTQEHLNYVSFPKCPSAKNIEFLVDKLITSIPK